MKIRYESSDKNEAGSSSKLKACGGGAGKVKAEFVRKSNLHPRLNFPGVLVLAPPLSPSAQMLNV